MKVPPHLQPAITLPGASVVSYAAVDATTHMSSSDDDAPKNLAKLQMQLADNLETQPYDPSDNLATQAYNPIDNLETQAYETNVDLATQAYDPTDDLATQAYDPTVDLATQAYETNVDLATQAYDPTDDLPTQAYDPTVDLATQAYDSTDDLTTQLKSPAIKKSDNLDDTYEYEAETQPYADSDIDDIPDTAGQKEAVIDNKSSKVDPDEIDDIKKYHNKAFNINDLAQPYETEGCIDGDDKDDLEGRIDHENEVTSNEKSTVNVEIKENLTSTQQENNREHKLQSNDIESEPQRKPHVNEERSNSNIIDNDCLTTETVAKDEDEEQGNACKFHSFHYLF